MIVFVCSKGKSICYVIHHLFALLLVYIAKHDWFKVDQSIASIEDYKLVIEEMRRHHFSCNIMPKLMHFYVKSMEIYDVLHIETCDRVLWFSCCCCCCCFWEAELIVVEHGSVCMEYRKKYRRVAFTATLLLRSSQTYTTHTDEKTYTIFVCLLPFYFVA